MAPESERANMPYENTFRAGLEWALREVWRVKSGSLEQERMREKIVEQVKTLRSYLAAPCDHRRLNAGIKGTFCADCREEITDNCFRPEEILKSPNEPTLTCSEVVRRLVNEAMKHQGDSTWLDPTVAEAILHSWRERRVQELEELLAKQSGCSHCTDSASSSISANDPTEIRKGAE